MSINKIRIDEFLKLAGRYPVFDVRSPGEYAHAHIPGAYSLPLFTDDERKLVGTTYKQESREAAIKIGLDFFGPKMKRIVEDAEVILKSHSAPGNCILLHCWRGGMRSAGVAWLLDLYGFKVYTLSGGYKAFRHWVLDQFSKPYPFRMLGGYTGSGKTVLLQELKSEGETIIDLEDIAKHKGSAFGAIDGCEQPGQEMFENLLVFALEEAAAKAGETNGHIWVEDESQRIGLVNLPNDLWKAMRSAPVYFLDIPFEERLDNIVQEYGKLNKERLVNAIMRIQKRLGGLDTKTAINYLLEDNVKECFRVLLKYYDKHYGKALNAREGLKEQLQLVLCSKVDPKINLTRLKEQNVIA